MKARNTEKQEKMKEFKDNPLTLIDIILQILVPIAVLVPIIIIWG